MQPLIETDECTPAVSEGSTRKSLRHDAVACRSLDGGSNNQGHNRQGIRTSAERVESQSGAMAMDERLLTVAELARYLGVPIGTLYQWRYRREGPPGFRVGRHVRYRRNDVEMWVREQLDQEKAG